MPAHPLPVVERQRRQVLIENLLAQGYSPPGMRVKGAKSALEEAGDRDGRPTGYFHKWVKSELAYRTRGLPDFAPDFGVYKSPTFPAATAAALEILEEDVEVSPEEHAHARARSLSDEITGLVTRSRYPLVNPHAILVDSYLTRRYDRKTKEYKLVEGTPQTWLTGTLKVAPVVDPRGRKFLFTGAQNDAPIHRDFWLNLQSFAAHIGAEIVVGPWTYETQWWSENNPTARAYDRELSEYLCFGQMQIGPNFVFCGEMNTLPTASAPISDLVTYSQGKWAVFPHAKRQLKSVPSTDPSQQAHQVMTTGAVTLPKVIARKAGVKSIFHHVIGATLVEFDWEGDLFCRQITADKDGSFYDLDCFVNEGEVSTGHRARAVVVGDLHLRKLDPINAMATFGFNMLGTDTTYRNSVLDTLNPEHVFLHDIFDNESRNHHHAGDNAYSYEMAVRGRDSVANEIIDVAAFLGNTQHENRRVVVVESNHDIGLERWVREGRYRNDGANIMLGLKLEAIYLEQRALMGCRVDQGVPSGSFSLLEHAVRLMYNIGTLDGVDWVHDGHSLLVDGVECGHHGFRGANGAKGSVAGFARIGRKMNIGDKHTPEIMDGVYVAGCMNLKQGYNRGTFSLRLGCISYRAVS
jgi:hypothetical protein